MILLPYFHVEQGHSSENKRQKSIESWIRETNLLVRHESQGQ